jgi:POT family proton-dependent oligopeptide transporter
MSLGALMLSLSFLVLYFVLKDTLATDKISCGWLVLCTFIYTTGELYLSPIGLSLVSKVSPVKWVSLLMGMWFLSSFFGNYLSGYLGTFYDTLSKDHFFLMLSIIAGVTGLAIMCVKPLLKQVNRSVH